MLSDRRPLVNRLCLPAAFLTDGRRQGLRLAESAPERTRLETPLPATAWPSSSKANSPGSTSPKKSTTTHPTTSPLRQTRTNQRAPETTKATARPPAATEIYSRRDAKPQRRSRSRQILNSAPLRLCAQLHFLPVGPIGGNACSRPSWLCVRTSSQTPAPSIANRKSQIQSRLLPISSRSIGCTAYDPENGVRDMSDIVIKYAHLVRK